MSKQTTIRACDVINQTVPRGAPLLSDSEIFTTCPNCRTPTHLEACFVTTGRETTYRCAACGAPLLIIGAPERDGPWLGRGTRISDFVLRNVAELRFRGLSLRRSPNALATSRSKNGA